MTDVPILTSEAEVEELAAALLKESSVAIDLEMDSMHNYQDKICLAQISTPADTFIIDPLAGGNLAPLAPVFSAPDIRKIFHAADYDLRSLKRDYGFEVRGLFDTMVSSQLCGEEKIGLADLLAKYFGVVLDKKYQRADWSQRPLKNEMIRYAAEDTIYLHRLVAILEEKLESLGRLSWVEEECEWLEKVAFDVNTGPLFLRFKGAGRLERRQLAALEELLQWRDREAERRNCPHFKIVGNKQILSLVQIDPATTGGLNGVEGLSERQVGRYGRSLLECLESARAVDEEQLPHFPRPARSKKDPQADKLLTELKSWRTKKAVELGLDPGVLINNSLLEIISRRRPGRVDALQEITGLRRWQFDLLGKELVAIVS